MFGYNPIVGTYCAGVRVGNWFEDIALQEVGGCNNSMTVVTKEKDTSLDLHVAAAIWGPTVSVRVSRI